MEIRKVGSKIFMIDLKPRGIREFVASYVLVGDKIAIVECGPASTTKDLILGLKELKVDFEKVEYVMVSHAHVDHWGSAGVLLDYLPNARLVIHPMGLPHLANPEKLWMQSKIVLNDIAEVFGKPYPVPKERMIPAKDGAVMDLGGEMEIQIIETLGHAPHHVSYFDRLSGSLFPGETAGIYIEKLDVILPATPPIIMLDKLLGSLERLASLNPKTLYYTHFGPAGNAVEKLKMYHRQLRIWRSTIEECCRSGENLDSIKERLSERDLYLKTALDYVKKHSIFSRVFPRLIEGFIVK